VASKAHPGFERVAGKIAKKQGVSKERARAIAAAGARKASKKAVKANPRLKKVSGVKKASEPIVSARTRQMNAVQAARAVRKP
jgi:hypothetical protein